MIHRNIFMKLQLPFLIVILLTNTAHSKNTSQELVTLHEAIGPVIDANENERFYLFSRDVGLIAAKVYHRSADKWLLHLLGEKDGKPWMLIRSLGAEQKMKLTNRIRNGLNKQKAENEKSPSFSAPVYKIELPLEFATDQPVKIKLEDNTQLYGRLIQCRQDTIQFVTLTDLKLEISENKITEIRWPQGEIFEGAFLKYDPNHIRLFFGPTGRTLKKGEANFADFYVFFPTLAVGLTDFVMIGGGVSLIPGARTQLFYVSPKVRLMHLENIDLAAGLLYMVVPEEGSFTSAYTVFSYGNPLGGLTIGVAIPLNEDTALDSPALLVGAEKQISNHAKLITENWLFTGENSFYLISAGFRLIGERLTVGLGLFTSPEFFDSGGFPFIPWLDFSVSFGK